MGDTRESRHEPAVGDVYVFPIARRRKLGALQIIARSDERHLVTVVALSWIGEHAPADAEALTATGRMIPDFMLWKGRELRSNVALPIPADHIFVGNVAVSGETESHAHGYWTFGSTIAAQHRWNELPTEMTARFKTALESDEQIFTPGLVDSRTGDPTKHKIASALRFTDHGGYTITDEFTFDALRAWPTLSTIGLTSWRDGLIPFLESAPLLGELALSGHGQREIDLSRTNLTSLSIDMTGLERLILPESVDRLALHGTPPESLRIEALAQGRWIELQQGGPLAPVVGLEHLYSLSAGRVQNLSIADVRARHPNVRKVSLFGAPGVLRDVDALADLVKLESLWLVDLFGYTSADFPHPDQLPALRSLDLESIPAEVATWARRAFKTSPHIELAVRKPRKPEWLEENLDNPLRAWDGSETIPASVVKKVAAAWRTAIKAVRTASGDTETIAAVMAFVGVIQAANITHQFLYTVERDEVIEAVTVLTTQLSDAGQRVLEPLVEEALDD